MRAYTFAVFFCSALLVPKVSNAQAYAYGTPPPEVTAAAAEWQARGEPIVVNGLIYFPTRAFRLFDAGVMAQTGIYEGVPVYSDVTLEPFSIVYVPVSASNMRMYERRRQGALAGTSGSRTPSFPVDIASPTVLANAQRANAIAAIANARNQAAAISEGPVPGQPAVGTGGGNVSPSTIDRPRDRPTRIESIPRPTPVLPQGVWLEFKGSRWYLDGSSVPFSPERFERIGEYRGFPVYRDTRGGADDIWVSVVKGGRVAPYAKR